MKWIEEKQALYRRNQELVEKVRPAHRLGVWLGPRRAGIPHPRSWKCGVPAVPGGADGPTWPSVLLTSAAAHLSGSPEGGTWAQAEPGVPSRASIRAWSCGWVLWLVMVIKTLKELPFRNHWNHPNQKPPGQGTALRTMVLRADGPRQSPSGVQETGPWCLPLPNKCEHMCDKITASPAAAQL